MMKKLLYTSLMVCALAVPAQGADLPTYNWRDGENISFNVYWGALKAGRASMVYQQNMSENTYSINVNAYTKGFARVLFELDDQILSNGALQGDAYPFQPSVYQMILAEGDYRANKHVTYNAPEGQVIFQNKLQSLEPTSYDVEPTTRDLLSAMYYLRDTVDASIMKIGDTYTLPIFGTKRPYTMDARIAGEEELLTAMGTLKLWRIEPTNTSKDEAFDARESKPWSLWVTQNDMLLPVRIDVHLKVGTFKARIRSAQPFIQ